MKERIEAGLAVRREVMGAEWVDPLLAQAAADPFTREIQDMIAIAWGTAWTRPGLDRRTRSMINLAMLTALGKMPELRGHARGALVNGVTREEITEVLLHATVYAGVPAGVEAFRNVKEALDAAEG